MKPRDFKLISILVAVSLIWQDAMWAFPELLRPVAFSESKHGKRVSRRQFLKLSAAAVAAGILIGQEKRVAGGPEFPDLKPLPEVPSSVLHIAKGPIRLLSDISGFEISQDTGTIDTIFINGDNTADPFLVEFFKSLQPEVKIVFVVSSDRLARQLWHSIENVGIENLFQRVKILIAEYPRTRWMQDVQKPWVNSRTGQVALVYPNTWYYSMPTINYGLENLAQYDGKAPVSIEGGDFTADDEYVYTSLATTKGASLETVGRLSQFCKRKVIVFPMRADKHNDRYHIPLGVINGERTSVVANPLLLLEETAAMTEGEKKEALEIIKSMHPPDEAVKFYELLFRTAGQRIEALKKSVYFKELKMVKDILKAHGIRCVEIPGIDLHWSHFKTEEAMDYSEDKIGFYYTNGVQDVYTDLLSGQPVHAIIIPRYGIPRLDNLAKKTYEGLGLEVKQVNCVSDSLVAGAARCRVAVVRMPASHYVIPKKLIGVGAGIAAVGVGVWWFLHHREMLKEKRTMESSI